MRRKLKRTVAEVVKIEAIDNMAHWRCVENAVVQLALTWPVSERQIVETLWSIPMGSSVTLKKAFEELEASSNKIGIYDESLLKRRGS